ncbi:MAG: ribosome maturation factor RimP [Pseudomonadota bacterium]
MSISRELLEKRFFKETGPAAEIAHLAEPVLEELGLRLVRVVVSGRDGCTVQVMIDRPEEIVTVEDCTSVSRQLSPILDTYDPIKETYNLEVSSPGLDRPLVRLSDFQQWMDYETKIELRDMIEGRKRFRGHIHAIAENEVHIKLDLEGYENKQIIGIPVHLIESAKLVMTDELLKAAQSNK